MYSAFHPLRKHGYYTVGDHAFLMKKDAQTFSRASKNKLTWHCMDDAFDKYDTTQDPYPDLSLDDLYLKRAKALREEFDYVILMFSGGPDCTNILETFVKNNLIIDEIVNFNSYDKTQTVNGTLNNADYIYNVKPKIERLQNDYRNFNPKITILDEIELCKLHWENSYKHGWEDHAFATGGPTSWAMRAYVLQYVPRLWNRIMAGDKICVIGGCEKINLQLKNNRYAMMFNDGAVGNYKEFSLEVKIPNGEKLWQWFYSDSSCPEIHIKQAHELKKFMDAHPEPEYYEPVIKNKIVQPNHVCSGRHGQGNLKYSIFHQIIYPGWTPRVVTPKSANWILRPQDCWWVNDIDSSARSIYNYSMRKYVQQNITSSTKDLGTGMLNYADPVFIE